jgi:hypothetical protein
MMDGEGSSLREGPPLTKAHIWPHQTTGIEIAIGGTFAEFDLGVGVASSGGGLRGEVTGFSKASRRRMLKLVTSLDRTRISVNEMLFVTLTYRDYEPDGRQWKADLAAWRKRAERRFGPLAGVWKLEPQERGAPHWHLLLRRDCGVTGGDMRLRERMVSDWLEIVGQGATEKGQKVERVRSWRGVMSYAAKYVAKSQTGAWVDQETGEVLKPGRVWGVWRSASLPIAYERLNLPRAVVHQVRRQVRRQLGRRGIRLGSLRNCSYRAVVFWDSAEIKKMAEFFMRERVERGAGAAQAPASTFTQRPGERCPVFQRLRP